MVLFMYILVSSTRAQMPSVSEGRAMCKGRMASARLDTHGS